MRDRTRRRWLLALLFSGILPSCSGQSAVPREQQDAAGRGATLWNQIRRALLDLDHGQSYFENLKDASLPPRTKPEILFVGTVIALDSGERPTWLLLSMADTDSPEITLQVPHPVLSKPLAVGMKVAFEGIVVGYTANPFMLYLDARRLSVFPA
jgi:hypothetical protein